MEHFEALRTYLSTFLAVPPLEWPKMLKLLRLRKLDKDIFLFQQGEVSDEIGFVVSGLLYNFYTFSNGEMRVKTFLAEGDLVACYSDLLLGVPASFSCRTLEKTTLVTLKYKDLMRLYDGHKCWERMGRISAEKQFIEKEQRELEFLSMDAKARYQSFVQDKAKFANRIPQYLIASYLGISAPSLSRIRAEI